MSDEHGENFTPPNDSPAKEWQWWFTAGSLTFYRKLVHEMGFDGLIKIFAIKTDEDETNKQLEGKLFLDFYHPVDRGIFLRRISTPSEWPNTSLVFLDYSGNEIKELIRSNSSFLAWPVKTKNDTEFTLITEHGRKPIKGFNIKHVGDMVVEPFEEERR